MNKQILKGNWHVVRGRIKQVFGDLTDDDLQRMEGNSEEMYGILQARTGRSREEIERKLEDMFGDVG